jgi:hypothetical protein
MELEVSAHLRSNCVLINTSKPIGEQVAMSVWVRRVVGLLHQPRKNEGVLRAFHRFTSLLRRHCYGIITRNIKRRPLLR